MSEEKRATLELTELELRILIDLCIKELLRRLHHEDVNLNLVDLTNKAGRALHLIVANDAQEAIPR